MEEDVNASGSGAATICRLRVLRVPACLIRDTVYGVPRESEVCGAIARVNFPSVAAPSNWLREYFDAHRSGKGIYKWLHYFDIYDEHFSRFRGKDVTVLEIGVASGGSLEMWKAYFGNEAQIYGVDIRPECKAL